MTPDCYIDNTMTRDNQQIVQKRLKSEKDDGDQPLHLLDLPQDLLRLIIKYSAPNNPNERLKWLNCISGMCRVFHAIAKKNEVLPTVFETKETFMPQVRIRRNIPTTLRLIYEHHC